jgi:glutamate-1-semialdehyde 2,1-aminomutase
MFKRGKLTLGTHNLSYSHKKDEVDSLLKVYEEVLPLIKSNIENHTLLENIKCDVLEPLFKTR